MSKQYAHLHAMAKNICEVSKRLAKNVRRSCAHKSIVDEWSNGQTDERTGHGTPISHLRANACATTKQNKTKTTTTTNKKTKKKTTKKKTI